MITEANSPTCKYGLHLPKEIKNYQKWSTPWVKLISFVILKGIIRLFYVVSSNFLCIFSYLLLMTVLRPVKLVSAEFYWFIEGVLFRWLQYLVSSWLCTAGHSVQVFGDDLSDIERDRALLIVNHQSTADVPLLMFLLQFHGYALDNLLWIMDILMWHTPFGWVSRMHGDFFIRTGKELRDRSLDFLREHLQKDYLPRRKKWIVLFVEGGFLWKMKKSSQEFAKKNGFPVLEHCTLPRLGAMETILKTLNQDSANEQPLKWLVDVTIAYSEGRPLNCQTITFGQRDPTVTTVHYKKIPISEIPFEGPELRDWLFERYAEKDKKLELFYKTGIFPTENFETPRLKYINYAMVVFVIVFFSLLAYLEMFCFWGIFSYIRQMVFS